MTNGCIVWAELEIGQVTQLLPNRFASVLGSDPSSVMIEQAKKQNTASNVTFVVSAAEDIATKVDPASIDLVVAGMHFKLSLHREIAYL